VIIAAGNKVIFAVSFKPAQRGIQQHRILFAYNSLKSPDSVQVVGTGIEPLFATTRDSVPFGKVRVSKEKVDSILITNNGNMALTVSSVISTNPNFSLLTSGLSVPSDESRPFVIKFSPATSGVKNGKIIFNHDAKSSPDTIAVSGTGVEPLFLATKKQLDFGEVRKNTSTMQTLLIKNPGSMELTIHRVNTQTTNYSAMPTNVIIGAGDSASFTVTFKPQSRGIINEYLVFQHDASSVSDTVFLSGVGTEPLFSLSRSKIDYKGVRINQIKLDSFYIRNPGNTQLTISSIEVPVGEFKVRPLVGAVMQQDSMFFQTEFQPFTTGPKSVTVLIHHNASAIPDTLLLSGTGIEPLYVMTPRSLKFGDVLVKTAKADTITISNPGTDTLHFSEIFLSDSMYQITPAVKTLAPAGTHKCIVTFKPVAAADRPAVIVFKHDAKTSPDSLYLSGRGVEPLFAFDKDSIKFGKVLVGQSRLDSVIVRNDGTSVLTIVSVAPIDTINFAVAPEMAAVQPGGKQTFIITFAPKTGGLRSTMMVFAHNARQGRDSLTISGQGLEAMTIAQARKMPSGTEVVIEGIVTRAKGTATRLQDTTAGIAIFHPAGVFHDSVNTGGITSGDLIRIVGRISEQEYLKRFTDVDISSFERLARDKTLPKPVLVTLKELGKNGELYESQLVTISGLQLVNTNDTLFAPLKNYAMIDSSDTSKLVSLSIGKPVDTDIDSTKCPKGTFTFLGVVGQVHPADSSRGYQLVPIYDGDIKADPTDIKDQMLAVIPDRYILFHNFPNPFNPSTTIRFGLPVRSSVLLEIYNIVGQRIDILVNEEKEAGYYDVHWLADVPSGVYFYRIESSAVGEKSKKFIEVRKMLLLK
jgi:uncharacterized protein YdeI (BOF family)